MVSFNWSPRFCLRSGFNQNGFMSTLYECFFLITIDICFIYIWYGLATTDFTMINICNNNIKNHVSRRIALYFCCLFEPPSI